MNASHIIALIGILMFATGSAIVPTLRALVLKQAESHKTISDGLTGPWHWFEDAGFAALSAALIYLGIALASPVSWLAWLVAAGVAGAMLTDTFRLGGTKYREYHLISAGVAFVGALFLEIALAHGWLLWALVIAYPVSVGAMHLMWPKYTAWQEKTAAAAIVLYLVVWGFQ